MVKPTRIPKIPSSEITAEKVYVSRRSFLKGTLWMSAAAALAACAPRQTSDGPTPSFTPVSEVIEELTPYEDITNYNNFYEFSLDKERVAPVSKDFRTSPWTVEVYGLVQKPATFGIEDLLSIFTEEERIYRLRCVEGWSMVIPWLGFPLAKLLKEVEPMTSARYVRFETIYDPDQMPVQRNDIFPWPYQEGLRLDEAMNELTILSTGLYGEALLPQNGAPLRLVVPWKYGFKSIKSIVKIELIEAQPTTMWSTIAPHEYGFYANVNPTVDHPRWSQSTERRIGEVARRETLLFNGYSDQVSQLYTDMDLSVNF